MHKYVWEIEINKGAARWIVERQKTIKIGTSTTQMHKEISDWAGALV